MKTFGCIWNGKFWYLLVYIIIYDDNEDVCSNELTTVHGC